MIAALVWLAVIAICVAGVAALASKRPMSDEEYEERRGKGAALGNALLTLQDFFEPQRGQAGKARTEQREEVEPQGDPPEPGDPDSRHED
ncbi:MAG TPA: hypothetical protein VNI57_15360 [Candidatus Saccharimonadales bacterium]|nr:hypothetical protein [Candidatus Saccharimonadales bacterium]